MSKKKKKKKLKIKNRSTRILKMVDKTLNINKDEIIKEIEDLQNTLSQVDIMLYKKGRKRNNSKYLKAVEEKKKAVRLEVINKIERIISIFTAVSPIIVIISRLIAALIIGILSIPSIKVLIKPKTLRTLNFVYDKAMKVSEVIPC